MDKQRDQESNNPSATDHYFTNSMMEDNAPSNDGSPNAGANDDNRRGIGAAERNVYKDSGSDTPVNPKYPLPPDPHSPAGKDYAQDGDSAELSDFGLDETKDVGHSASINQYGIVK